MKTEGVIYEHKAADHIERARAWGGDVEFDRVTVIGVCELSAELEDLNQRPRYGLC